MRDPYEGCIWILHEGECVHKASSVASAFWRALNCFTGGTVVCYDPDYSELEPLQTWSYEEIQRDLGPKVNYFDDLYDWLYDYDNMEDMEFLRRGGE